MFTSKCSAPKCAWRPGSARTRRGSLYSTHSKPIAGSGRGRGPKEVDGERDRMGGKGRRLEEMELEGRDDTPPTIPGSTTVSRKSVTVEN